MIPKAMLVVYQPKHRCRFKKYFLKAGTNLIGTNSSCDVVLPSQHIILPKLIATINLTQQLMTLQSHANQVAIISNMSQKKKIVKIPSNVHYVIEMQKQFYINNYQCLVQILQLQQLYQVKNIENAQNFLPKNNIHNNQVDSNKTQEINLDGMFEPTLQINDYDGSFEGTLIINDQIPFQYQRNIQNQTNLQNVYPEINLSTQTQKSNQILSLKNKQETYEKQSNINQQEKLKDIELHKQNKQNQIKQEVMVRHIGDSVGIQQSLSMPDTIVDEMPQTINASLENQMPETIKDHQIDNLKQKVTQKLVKTTPLNQAAKLEEQKVKKIKSFEYDSKKITKQNYKNIEDFQDLFNVKQTNKELKQHKQPQKNQNISEIKIQIENQKKNTIQQKVQKQQNKQQINQIIKKIAVTNCKLNQQLKNQLRKKKMQIISHPDQQYEILIIGNELKRSTRLMIALLEGKQIHNQLWILNPSAKINGKLQGFLWDDIQKRKGKKGQIFKGKYYLCESIKEQFWDVMIVGGATMIQDVTRKYNQQINIILTKQDKQFFEAKKKYKKWKFYQSRMIIESVLIGQEVKQKYEMDQYSF